MLAVQIRQLCNSSHLGSQNRESEGYCCCTWPSMPFWRGLWSM